MSWACVWLFDVFTVKLELLKLWCSPVKANGTEPGRPFYGNCSIFIALAIDMVRFSNLTEDHTGSWRNSWQMSLCLPAKWSFPKTIYLPQESCLLIDAWPPPRTWVMNRAIVCTLPIHSVFPLASCVDFSHWDESGAWSTLTRQWRASDSVPGAPPNKISNGVSGIMDVWIC